MMGAGLDAAIRAKLAEIRKNAQRTAISADEEQDPRLAAVADDAEALADALNAVLGRHQPDPGAEEYCLTCVEWNDDPDGDLVADQLRRPCPMVRAIAKELGLEVDG